MKEEELHKKMKEFFEGLGINNIHMEFVPNFRTITIMDSKQKQIYLNHEVRITFEGVLK